MEWKPPSNTVSKTTSDITCDVLGCMLDGICSCGCTPICQSTDDVVKKSFSLLAMTEANDQNTEEIISYANFEKAICCVVGEEIFTVRKMYPNLQELYNQTLMTRDRFHALISSGMFHPIDKERHWVAVSLAEAETVRRVLHISASIASSSQNTSSNESKNDVLKGTNIALR